MKVTVETMGYSQPRKGCNACGGLGALAVECNRDVMGRIVAVVDVLPCSCVVGASEWMPQWAKLQTAVCPDCEGDGWVDCSCCGAERECKTCEGSGHNRVARDWSHDVSSREVDAVGLVGVVRRWEQWREDAR